MNKNNKNKLFLLSIMLFLVLILSGCSISLKTNEGGGNDGGVFRSADKGDRWAQKVLIPTISGRPRSIGGLNVVSLAMDPSDNKAIYLGSEDNGLFYTYDRGENWFGVAGLIR